MARVRRCVRPVTHGEFDRWAEARIKIARMTLTIKLDGNWSSFQLAINLDQRISYLGYCPKRKDKQNACDEACRAPALPDPARRACGYDTT